MYTVIAAVAVLLISMIAMCFKVLIKRGTAFRIGHAHEINRKEKQTK